MAEMVGCSHGDTDCIVAITIAAHGSDGNTDCIATMLVAVCLPWEQHCDHQESGLGNSDGDTHCIVTNWWLLVKIERQVAVDLKTVWTWQGSFAWQWMVTVGLLAMSRTVLWLVMDVEVTSPITTIYQDACTVKEKQHYHMVREMVITELQQPYGQ